MYKLLLSGLLASLLSLSVSAANYPCSGSKGGVSHCNGATFICNDGSTSASKRNCSAVHSGQNSNTVNRAYSAPKAGPEGSCSCSSGSYCTGPRGGVYCITSGGKKSYKR